MAAAPMGPASARRLPRGGMDLHQVDDCDVVGVPATRMHAPRPALVRTDRHAHPGGGSPIHVVEGTGAAS
jgi:hypothetical protein